MALTMCTGTSDTELSTLAFDGLNGWVVSVCVVLEEGKRETGRDGAEELQT